MLFSSCLKAVTSVDSHLLAQAKLLLPWANEEQQRVATEMCHKSAKSSVLYVSDLGIDQLHA